MLLLLKPISSLTDSGSHFHHSGSNRAHIFMDNNIKIITSVIAILWHGETLQHEFRSGYNYLDEMGPLFPFTWLPALGLQQKAAQTVMFTGSLGSNASLACIITAIMVMTVKELI